VCRTHASFCSNYEPLLHIRNMWSRILRGPNIYNPPFFYIAYSKGIYDLGAK
jgi:hypothetical protein